MQDWERKKYLIFFKDESDNIIKAYSNILEIKEGLVTFETLYNKITIASNRILKIKELKGGGE
ncbi:hypothetical protein K8R47_02775 [archaeon]|nr:hypothetical protein [archaeon]